MNFTHLIDRVLTKAAPVLTTGAVALAMAHPALAFQAKAADKTTDVTSLKDVLEGSGIVGLVIILLSVVALALVIENMVSIKRDKLAPPELIDEIQALFDEEQFQEAMELCENEKTFFTRIVGAGIAKIGHPYEVIEKAIEEMGDEEAIKLHQKIGWLPVIANAAPMLGLLGTVTGMVASFNVIASSQGQANPADLASGISQALLTTMEGLIVAIPVTAVFAFLRNRLIRIIIEVGAIVEDLFERFRPNANT